MYDINCCSIAPTTLCQLLKSERSIYRSLLRHKKASYWRSRVVSEQNSPRLLWRSIDTLMGRGRPPLPTSTSQEDFLAFFRAKVSDIRAKTANTSSPDFSDAAVECTLAKFKKVSHDDVLNTLHHLSNKHSLRDPIPTSLLKKCADLLYPFLTYLINLSLSSGTFPAPWKKANISPIPKKSSADSHDVSSYRPISNLPVLAKMLERNVSSQLQQYIIDYDLLPPQQSAYRPRFSCETAVLKITSDVLSSLDEGNVCLLSFLDLTSAFDCVDYEILSQRLRSCFGLRDTALDWLESFLHNRMMRVCTSSSTEFVPVHWGVPQGSVLGPLLFSLYVSDLVPLVHKHDLQVHLFADDVLVYGFSSSSSSSVLSSRVTHCLEELDVYLKSLKLLLNPQKMNFLWCQSPRRRPLISSPIVFNGAYYPPCSHVKYLGVILDSHLSFSANVTLTSNSCFAMLRRIRSVKSSLTQPLLKSLISSLVLSRLDYCISVLAGLPASTLWRLQRVIHASARLVFGARRWDHVGPLLRDLKWLPIKDRIESRLATLAFLCREGLAPSYLSSELHNSSSAPGRASLRSASSGRLCLPRCRRSTFGGRAFPSTATRAWNRLPPEVILCKNEASFKASLKLFLSNKL